jgi:hypothetical protein
MLEFNDVHVANSLDNDFLEIGTCRENEMISVYI